MRALRLGIDGRSRACPCQFDEDRRRRGRAAATGLGPALATSSPGMPQTTAVSPQLRRSCWPPSLQFASVSWPQRRHCPSRSAGSRPGSRPPNVIQRTVRRCRSTLGCQRYAEPDGAGMATTRARTAAEDHQVGVAAADIGNAARFEGRRHAALRTIVSAQRRSSRRCQRPRETTRACAAPSTIGQGKSPGQRRQQGVQRGRTARRGSRREPGPRASSQSRRDRRQPQSGWSLATGRERRREALTLGALAAPNAPVRPVGA
jgi:hypothetical protein